MIADATSSMEITELKESLRQAMRRRIETDLVPYEGQWVARSVREAKLHEDRAKARIRALELLLLYLGSAFVSLSLIGVTWFLCY